MLDVPVLMLVFNRLETTKIVFERVRQAKPRYLYVVADGARPEKEGEAQKCEAVRQLFTTEVDWDCTVVPLFRAENLGCRKSVADGISWFFSQVAEGIILEDDCVPNESFFSFCTAMLDKYRTDDSVMHISGARIAAAASSAQANGYIFSRIPYVWGWATWRRAWQHYDAEMEKLPAYLANKADELNTLGGYFKKKCIKNFELVKNYQLNTWDYQWSFTIIERSGKCIVPTQNLVSNIGFGNDATHTTGSSLVANQPTTEMQANYIQIGDGEADFSYDKQVFGLVYGKNLFERAKIWLKTKLNLQ